MPTVLVIAVVSAALLTVLLGATVSLRGRRPGRLTVGAAVTTGALVVVQSVVAGIGLAEGRRPAELGTAVGYLVGIVVVMPLGIGWSLADPSRYSGYVVAVAAFTVAVMTARLVMIW